MKVLYRLLPGPDFSVGSAAELLGEDIATTIDAITALVELGALEPSGMSQSDLALGDSATAVMLRYKSTAPPTRPFVLPADDRETDALHRVLRRLLLHSTAVAVAIAPGEFRFADLGPLPVFADGAAAVGWFTAERESVLVAQRVAYALRDLPMTWRFAEAAYPALELLRRHEDQFAVQDLGATAADMFNHASAAVCYARLGSSWNALGRYRDAVVAGRRAQVLAERHGHAWSRFTVHMVLGVARRGLRQYDQAFAEFYAAWEIDVSGSAATPVGYDTTPHTSFGLVAAEIALTHLAAGDAAAALAPARQAVEHLARDPGRRRDTVWARIVLGRVLTAVGQTADAIDVLDTALDALDWHVDLDYAARIKQERADAAAAHGDHEQAQRDRHDAIRLHDLAGHHDLADRIRHLLMASGTDTPNGADARDTGTDGSPESEAGFDDTR
ncbi:hypothetical protein [Saccharothrix sp. NRRL B-16348]|uniref:hypothetical protein n=1 Tax=Saccharothrix sp. NRRL B-16348 TaxID=1415542 RepID=UPI0012F829A6|nr:hypothetical protein [Saccharothrix sp. NRRL B-16348]